MSEFEEQLQKLIDAAVAEGASNDDILSALEFQATIFRELDE